MAGAAPPRRDSGPLLADRVAIVTGASRGIGAAIARRFAAEGAKVALVARTLEPQDRLEGSLREVTRSIREAGGICCAIRADLTRTEELASIVAQTERAFGTADILVNNAAWARFPPIWEASSRHMELAFQMNLTAPHLLSQLVFPAMRAKGEGWILNITSASADVPPPAPWNFGERYFQYQRDGHPSLYGASKAALDRLTAGWAIELSGSGVAVNALAPVGAVASEGARALSGWNEEDHLEPVEAMAEAALQLCWRPASECSGEIARSLPLLRRFGVAIRHLDGKTLLGSEEARI